MFVTSTRVSPVTTAIRDTFGRFASPLPARPRSRAARTYAILTSETRSPTPSPASMSHFTSGSRILSTARRTAALRDSLIDSPRDMEGLGTLPDRHQPAHGRWQHL